MTTPKTGRKKPAHDLAAVHGAAAAGRVKWQDSVNDDLVKYEYLVSEVLQCIQALRAHHYSKTIDYKDGKGPFDVYLLPWNHFIPSQEKAAQDLLYIKIKVTHDGKAALMLSFHPSI